LECLKKAGAKRVESCAISASNDETINMGGKEDLVPI